MSNILKKIHFAQNSLEDFLSIAILQYNLGIYTSHTLIEVGYEDCNIKLTTTTGNYLVKIFADNRDPKQIERYIQILKIVDEHMSQQPKLYKNNQGNYEYEGTDHSSLIIMEFIEGKSFLDMKRAPDSEELSRIIEYVSTLHNLSFRPDYVFDSWAVPHLMELYTNVKEFLSSEDAILAEQVVEIFKTLDITSLPHAFVHGDLTKANIIIDNTEKLNILDFSVSNYYPRIQELAVIAANLMYDDGASSLKNRTDRIISIYSTHTKLTKLEIDTLYNYSICAITMELLGTYQEKYIHHDTSEETNYWLTIARNSLSEIF